MDLAFRAFGLTHVVTGERQWSERKRGPLGETFTFNGRECGAVQLGLQQKVIKTQRSQAGIISNSIYVNKYYFYN